MFREFLEVLHAADFGHEVGTLINEVLQPLIDEHEPGSGPLGDWYLETINEYFDPMHPSEILHSFDHDDN